MAAAFPRPIVSTNSGVTATPVWHGKCIPGNCRVAFKDGYLKIKDKMLIDIEGHVPNTSIDVITPTGTARTIEVYFEKNAKVRRCITVGNRWVSGTDDHLFLSVSANTYGLNRAGSLSIGDYAVFSMKPLDMGTAKYPLNQFYTLGLWLGEGFYNKASKSFGYSSRNKDMVTQFSSMLRYSQKMERVVRFGVELYEIGITDLRFLKGTIFEYIEKELEKSGDLKCVPEFVFSSSLKARVALIRGILDTCEMTLNADGVPGFEIAYKSLCDGVGDVLVSLGIPVEFETRQEEQFTDHGLVYKKLHTLRLRVGNEDPYNVLKLYKGLKELPAISLQEKGLKVYVTQREYDKVIAGKFPILHHADKNWKNRTARALRLVRELLVAGYPGNGIFEKEAFYFLERYGVKLPAPLKRRMDELFFDEIKEIKEFRTNVYDISIPNPHLFYSQGLVNQTATPESEQVHTKK